MENLIDALEILAIYDDQKKGKTNIYKKKTIFTKFEIHAMWKFTIVNNNLD